MQSGFWLVTTEKSDSWFPVVNPAYGDRQSTTMAIALQRVLDIFWMFHNFIRCHFTTRQVPAVALGILQKGLTWEGVTFS